MLRIKIQWLLIDLKLSIDIRGQVTTENKYRIIKIKSENLSSKKGQVTIENRCRTTKNVFKNVKCI